MNRTCWQCDFVKSNGKRDYVEWRLEVLMDFWLVTNLMSQSSSVASAKSDLLGNVSSNCVNNFVSEMSQSHNSHHQMFQESP